MSFREKSAWISLFSILLVAAYYLITHNLLVSLGAFVAIEVVGHLAVALRAPGEARLPKDERERLIEMRALRVAAPVYVLGSFFAVWRLHIGAGAVAIANGVLLAFIVAEIVNYSLRIVYHRRGF